LKKPWKQAVAMIKKIAEKKTKEIGVYTITSDQIVKIMNLIEKFAK